MADHIPFINSVKDCDILAKYYSDSYAIRISLENFSRLSSRLMSGPKRWIDAGVDGLHWPELSKEYVQYIKKFRGYERIHDAAFQRSPDKSTVESFTNAVLDSCLLTNPDWISVPQLPFVADSSRNKLNKRLAESSASWKSRRSFRGKFLIPAIFRGQKQIRTRSERRKRLELVFSAYEAAGADGVWIVDSTLSDQQSWKTYGSWFQNLVRLQEELATQLPPETISVAGPYWGMNLVLWARGLVQFPAIGLGGSYQYHIPGQHPKKPKSRIAIMPLRRWAIASPRLQAWLSDALRTVPPDDSAHRQFAWLLQHFRGLQADGRVQVARFYKQWFDKISAIPKAGRALALYQDLSSAYVLGRSLPVLPPAEKAAKDPAQVAQQLMLNCLPSPSNRIVRQASE